MKWLIGLLGAFGSIMTLLWGVAARKKDRAERNVETLEATREVESNVNKAIKARNQEGVDEIEEKLDEVKRSGRRNYFESD